MQRQTHEDDMSEFDLYYTLLHTMMEVDSTPIMVEAEDGNVEFRWAGDRFEVMDTPRDDVQVWHAKWVVQGRGYSVRLVSGYISIHAGQSELDGPAHPQVPLFPEGRQPPCRRGIGKGTRRRTGIEIKPSQRHRLTGSFTPAFESA